MASSKFTQAVEAYFTDLRLVRGSGGATTTQTLTMRPPTWSTLLPPFTVTACLSTDDL